MENCKGGLHIRPRGVEDAAPPQTERQNYRVRRCAARGFPARNHLPYARGPGMPGYYCAVTIMTRDHRLKERKKYGLKAARRAPQFSKR